MRRAGSDHGLLAELARLDETLQRLEREVARARAEVPPEPDPEPRPEPDIPAAAAPPEQLFDRCVEVDAGPFADFDELSSFERALAGLPQVADVCVRRFFDDRAIVELAATEELPLLLRLADVLPGGFTVEYVERAALKITLDAPLARTA
jgi:hypothetical protein